ncbi:MAG: hypothetical protein WBL07_02235, partial [Thiothrix litoralis]|uniref:hypothetical protein n=1 Tax=Thiothrix litoralis TaxID=2891210 RepID=UPI003C768896
MLVGEIERRKLIWRKIGDWMDTANSEDALPEFPDFGYSTSEKKLITAILQATAEKRLDVMSHGIIFPQGATHYSKHGLSLKASYPPMATRQSVHETASRS